MSAVIVRTSAGYEFETDNTEIKVGDVVEIPAPEVPEPKDITDGALNFYAQMFGTQKEWKKMSFGQYSAPDGLKRVPEFIMNLPEDRLKVFLKRMSSAGATLIRHYSNTSADSPEIRFKVLHKEAAHDLQALWLRVGIKTRVKYHSQLKKWIVQTSGMAAYVQMRSYILGSRNPRFRAKREELDSLVSFGFRLAQDFKTEDKVVEVA